MGEVLSALRRQRAAVLSANLVYFLALLFLGVNLFLRDVGTALWYFALPALAAYFLLVRPMTKRYQCALRGAILKYGVCSGLSEMTYDPKKGFSAEEFLASGLVTTVSSKAFLSREKVTGRRGALSLEMADTTFPILENGRNAMSSGLYVRLSRDGASFPEFTVRAGQTGEAVLPANAAALLREMASFVPGNLYISSRGDTMHVFFRGRFIGFQINPLADLSEKTLQANPLPEADQSLRLALMLDGHGPARTVKKG